MKKKILFTQILRYISYSYLDTYVLMFVLGI